MESFLYPFGMGKKRLAKRDAYERQEFETFCQQVSRPAASQQVVQVHGNCVHILHKGFGSPRAVILILPEEGRPYIQYEGSLHEPGETWAYPVNCLAGSKILVVLLSEGTRRFGRVNLMLRNAKGHPAWVFEVPKEPFDPLIAYRRRARVVILKEAWETSVQVGTHAVMAPDRVQALSMELFFSPEAECLMEAGGNAIAAGLYETLNAESLRLGHPNGILYRQVDEDVSPLLKALLHWLRAADSAMPWITDLGRETDGQPSPLYLAAVAVRDRTS